MRSDSICLTIQTIFMKKSRFITSVLFVFLLMTSCQKNELPNKKNELSDSNSLQSDLSQKNEGIKNDAERKNINFGSYYGGGIVFYIDETGKHGLIAATEDAGTAEWGCMGSIITGTSLNFGGQSNTLAILEGCEETATAARLCDTWVFRKKGEGKGKKYDDWFLPSFVELHILFERLQLLRNTDPNLAQLFANGPYWCSSQGDNNFMGTISDGATTAWLINLNFNFIGEPFLSVEVALKNFTAKVRPIRAF
jgi:hypothetical protein